MKRLFGVLLVLSGLLLFTIAGQVEAQAQGADDPAQLAAGQAVFEMTCAGCHAIDGTGVAGNGRALTGIASQGDRERHVASVTEGRGGMPAHGERLTAEEIDAAVTYVRLTFVEAAAETTAAEETDAAGEEPATELAATGINSTGLAVVGAVMLAAGVQLVAFSRRTDD